MSEGALPDLQARFGMGSGDSDRCRYVLSGPPATSTPNNLSLQFPELAEEHRSIHLELVLRKIHFLDEFLKSRFIAERIESGVHLQVS